MAGQPVLVEQQRLGSHCRKAKCKTAKALFLRQAGLFLRHIPAEHQKDGGKKYPVPGTVKKLEQQPVKVLYDRHPRGYPVVAVTKQANQVQQGSDCQSLRKIQLFHQPPCDHHSQYGSRQIP